MTTISQTYLPRTEGADSVLPQGSTLPAPALPANDHVPPPAPQLDPRLAALLEEHGDLDGAIAALLADGCRDDLQITRLKKRKLHIRDVIAAAAPPP